eukprot:1008054-Rhodomonas_salina.2
MSNFRISTAISTDGRRAQLPPACGGLRLRLRLRPACVRGVCVPELKKDGETGSLGFISILSSTSLLLTRGAFHGHAEEEVVGALVLAGAQHLQLDLLLEQHLAARFHHPLHQRPEPRPEAPVVEQEADP